MTDTDSVQVVPFDEALMPKKDMQNHFSECHGIRVWNLPRGDKTTKAELVSLHERRHAMEVNGSKEPAIPHTHTALPEKTDVQAAALEKANNPLGKALSAAERKALKDLVDNDFAVLRTEIEQFANDVLQQRLAEIEAEFGDKEDQITSFKNQARELALAYNEQLTALNEKFRKRSQDLTERAKVKGVDLSTPMPWRTPDANLREPSAEVLGKREAIKKAKDEVDLDRAKARNTLERQRLANQRRVLMLGVSQEGLQVIEEMPDARQMMVEAARQRAIA